MRRCQTPKTANRVAVCRIAKGQDLPNDQHNGSKDVEPFAYFGLAILVSRAAGRSAQGGPRSLPGNITVQTS